jgi:hypothetical protein
VNQKISDSANASEGRREAEKNVQSQLDWRNKSLLLAAMFLFSCSSFSNLISQLYTFWSPSIFFLFTYSLTLPQFSLSFSLSV